MMLAAAVRRRRRARAAAWELATIAESLTGRPLLIFRDLHGRELHAARRVLVQHFRAEVRE
jgi:hypothetical protein